MTLDRAIVFVVLGLVLAPRPSRQSPSPLGRWVGDSHCLGAHPACHDEHVIYQVDSTGPGQVRLDGSRVSGKDTVDMGPLSCRNAGSGSAIVCPIPNGLWRFAAVQDRLEGTLTLRDSTVMRRVVAYRAH